MLQKWGSTETSARSGQGDLLLSQPNGPCNRNHDPSVPAITIGALCGLKYVKIVMWSKINPCDFKTFWVCNWHLVIFLQAISPLLMEQ